MEAPPSPCCNARVNGGDEALNLGGDIQGKVLQGVMPTCSKCGLNFPGFKDGEWYQDQSRMDEEELRKLLTNFS